jgi:hypothetical protein
VAPGGEHPEAKQITFRLEGAGFESSAPITVTLELFDGQGGGHHD